MFWRKATGIAVATLIVIALFGGTGIATAHEGREHGGGMAKPQGVATSKTEKACPVTGEKIDPNGKYRYAYKGKVYDFCCADCIETFKEDPVKYIGKVKGEAARAAEAPIRPNHRDNP